MKSRLITLGTIALSILSAAHAAPTLLLKQPDLSAAHLTFVYAGDIWVADRDGRNPRQLTTHPAGEDSPVFSPDGATIAFAASYENNTDVYIVPVAGGQPKRLTWHPGDDSPTGWTADGQAVTFVSSREVDSGRSNHWYHVSVAGGLPTRQMAAPVYQGTYDASDSRLAYIAHGSGYNGLFGGTSGWKGYRGGTTPAVMIMDLEADSVIEVPGAAATNINPVWLADQLYFLSDRDDEEGRRLLNVYRYDAAGRSVERVTNERIWEVRSAGGEGSTLVYEAGGRLKTIDVESGATRELEITINPDLPQRRTQWKNAADTITAADISPTGKRAIVTARGEVFTVAVDEGPTRNVSATGAVREYSGIWSPDGDRIAFIRSDASGQVLRVTDQLGRGESRDYSLGEYYYDLHDWASGDSQRIVYSDNHLTLYVLDLDSGASTTISTGARRDEIEAAVSPDGRWLAYTEERPNYHRDLLLYNFDSGARLAVTDGAADVAGPAFSLDGKHLFFAASTNSGPLQVGLNMSSQERPYRAGLYALVLAATDQSPLLPDSGDESAESDDEESDEDSPVTVRIDEDGLQSRIVALPVAERNYGSLAAAEDGSLLYVQYVQPGISNGAPGGSEDEENALWRFDFDEKKAAEVVAGVDGFGVSANGSHLIVAKTDGSLAVGETGDEIELEPLNVEGLRVRVDPAVEWAQIFDEAWRMEQQYFYDPNMHGLDWQGVYDRYRPLVEHVGRRQDLSALIVEMIAEMQVGHNRSGGGDTHRERGANTGLLGANLVIDDGRYRLARVYTGESWNPFIGAPLATPGNEAREGEFILAVDGRDLSAEDNIFEFLQGTVGKQTVLTVGPRVDGRDARDITIEPVSSERMMRLWHWVEANRRAVDEATDGRVGYVYLPNTAGAGYTFFNRMFFAQLDKDAMIIDERSNGGGQAANYITDVLSRQHLSGWKDRDGLVFDTPAGAMHGPKVMLIDQDAGSGGDFLPYSFRQLGIGKLIGTRTWGGLIGIAANPALMDGGFLTVPFFRFFDASGEWSIENEGVAPDIEVQLDPIALNAGRDVQLERAIDEVVRQLRDSQNSLPSVAPTYPTRPGE